MATLFDAVPEDPPAQRHSPTSVAAADAVRPMANRYRAAVLAYLTGCGEAGATDEEMQRGIPMQPSTQRPRRVELQRAGLVRDAGQKRETASGRKAVVWVASTPETR